MYPIIAHNAIDAAERAAILAGATGELESRISDFHSLIVPETPATILAVQKNFPKAVDSFLTFIEAGAKTNSAARMASSPHDEQETIERYNDVLNITGHVAGYMFRWEPEVRENRPVLKRSEKPLYMMMNTHSRHIIAATLAAAPGDIDRLWADYLDNGLSREPMLSAAMVASERDDYATMIEAWHELPAPCTNAASTILTTSQLSYNTSRERFGEFIQALSPTAAAQLAVSMRIDTVQGLLDRYFFAYEAMNQTRQLAWCTLEITPTNI